MQRENEERRARREILVRPDLRACRGRAATSDRRVLKDSRVFRASKDRKE